MHDLRHAHASWLLTGGADLQVVKERLARHHRDHQRYLHSLPTADETALDALSRIRGPQLQNPPESNRARCPGLTGPRNP